MVNCHDRPSWLETLFGRKSPKTVVEHPQLAEWRQQQEHFLQLQVKYPGLAWYCEIRLRVLKFLIARYGQTTHRQPAVSSRETAPEATPPMAEKKSRRGPGNVGERDVPALVLQRIHRDNQRAST